MWWYLDFDGVLCDSIPEIWASSQRVVRGDWIPWEQTEESLRERFRRLRGLVRRGAEYPAVIRLLQANQDGSIRSFEDWSRHLDRLGPQALERDDRELYRIRGEWLETDPDTWLALNPPYPGVPEALRAAARTDIARILSTKRSAYILAILRAWGVEWPSEWVEETHRRKADLLDERGQPYILVDDQIEQLKRSSVGRCVLALWGPISPGAQERASEAWTLGEFLERFLSAIAEASNLPGGCSSPRG